LIFTKLVLTHKLEGWQKPEAALNTRTNSSLKLSLCAGWVLGYDLFPSLLPLCPSLPSKAGENSGPHPSVSLEEFNPLSQRAPATGNHKVAFKKENILGL
jgi:hypothetical protein